MRQAYDYFNAELFGGALPPCLITVQPELFGHWSLVREWGRIGSPGQSRIVSYATQEVAEAALMCHRRRKERREYR